jgi:hypothetical protein
MSIMSDNITGPRQGAITNVATLSASATTYNLAGSTFLGSAIAANGQVFTITSTVAIYWKLFYNSTTAVNKSAVSTAGTAGGAGQGSYLPAGVPLPFRFPFDRDNGRYTYLSVQSVDTNGTVTIEQSSSEVR